VPAAPPIDQLCDLAHHADAGFDRRVFATMLARIERLDDLDFTEYGVSAEHVAALRARVGSWLADLGLD
jgi:hypothetical protein